VRVDLFDFDLPKELIAQHPARPRDAAMLLVIGDPPTVRTVRELPELLRPGDLLVVNDTRVLPTRLRTDTVELTLVEPLGESAWRAFARPARRLAVGQEIALGPGLTAIVASKEPDGRVALRFALAGEALLAAIERHGAMPLPPYIRRRAPDPADRADYQTAFARVPGAVAAPTAGLHFTAGLLAALDARGVRRAALTLHVGMGTFAPVRVVDTDEHRLHAEWFRVPEATAAAIAATRAAGGRIVAVGTTVLRALESAVDAVGEVRPMTSRTELFVTPGWRFRTADLLLTNFHLPRSTLFMLVCAFGGLERMRRAYGIAIAERLRFYSYGDACLIERAAP
jgi:S-adenosylmethionine:tRNA ribosyltransferase-isomerase